LMMALTTSRFKLSASSHCEGAKRLWQSIFDR
jgi:hypothetical protein